MSTATGTTLCGERITAEGYDLTTTNGQKAYLMSGLGLTRPQAARMLKAYAADVADAVRVGNDTHRSDADFLQWLMSQAPGGRSRSVRRWRLGESGWRTK